jgi:hypothetical protein
LFKERKTRFALLSLLSALLGVSTAFVGISIYAQTDDSELTTFEEEAIAAGADMGDTGLEDTDAAITDDVANETETASTDDEASTGSADCIPMTSGDNETSTDATNATSTLSSTELTGNATGIDNATSTEPLDTSNATLTAACEGTVTLTPVEQNVGGTVLVNASGLAESSNMTVKVGDLVTGFPESDEEGNLLYALGISDEMSGSLTVTVEDGEGNVGSATLTIIESQEEQAGPENATNIRNTTQSTSNLTSNENNSTAQNIEDTTTAQSNETLQNEIGTFGQKLNSTDNESIVIPNQESTSSGYTVQ